MLTLAAKYVVDYHRTYAKTKEVYLANCSLITSTNDEATLTHLNSFK